MKRQFLLFICAIVGFMGCDLTTSNHIEGVWGSPVSVSGIRYVEQLTIEKGGAYYFERTEDGKSSYTEKGTWQVERKEVSILNGNHRVVTFVPESKEVRPYERLFSLENGGLVLVLGEVNLDTGEVLKQRYFKKGAKK